jgi:hypothetical protein
MADTVIQYDEPVPDRRPFQYSLRTLFIITTVLAILCAGLFAVPHWLRLVTAAICLFFIPLILVPCILYCRGYRRTFFIGALIVVGPLVLVEMFLVYTSVFSLLFYDSDPGVSPYIPGIVFFGILFLSLIAGLTTLFVRWIIESAQRKASQIEQGNQVPRET